MVEARWMQFSLFALGIFGGGSYLVTSCEGDKASGPDTADTAPAGRDTDPGGCIEDTQDTEPPVDTSLPVDTGPEPVDTSDSCPDGMMPVAGVFCMDIYEASRPDASSGSGGTDESRAASRAGVLPWVVDDKDEASAACAAAGKRLCTSEEWGVACVGPDETTYAYGDDYEAETCNGIDTHCNCEGGGDACQCPDGVGYSRCYYDCEGSTYYLSPTGSFPGCTNAYQIYDLNGNLWEYTLDGTAGQLRGGAYNCGDSASYHACSYVPGWSPNATGFRCCHDGDF